MSNRPRNYCGSLEPGHRSSLCKPCQAIRQTERRRRIAAGLPLLGPACALCGVTRGNSLGVKVYRYSLVRNFPSKRTKTGWTNRQVASIPVCDGCLIEGGYAREELVA